MLKIVIGVLAASALLAVAGCGGKSEAEKEKEATAAAAGSGRGTITCEGSATTKPTGLPSDFPQPDAVTYVSATKNGPTVVVDGYSTESLEGMYVEYKDRINEAGYKVEFSEIEEDNGDSEVAYKTPGADSTEGIVALRGGSSCANGNVSVHITNRPSD
jgi:Fe-S cluster assembly iron-binding protein IscA